MWVSGPKCVTAKGAMQLFRRAAGIVGEVKETAASGVTESEHVDATPEEEEAECLVGTTKQLTPDEFFQRSAQTTKPTRGETPEERLHWSRPRRWDVKLWNVRMENVTTEEMRVFAVFIFGGDREEFKIQREGGDPVIWVMGRDGPTLLTPVVKDIPGDGLATDLALNESFEWRGSYLDLERQVLRIELWNWAKNRVNKFDSCHEEKLISLCEGPHLQ